VGRVAELELDEIAGAPTQVSGDARQVRGDVGRPRQVGERIHRADRAAESPAELEPGQVRDQRVAPQLSPAQSLVRAANHLGGAVEADYLDVTFGQGRQHPSGTACGLQHRRAIASEALEQPIDLGRDIPGEGDVVELRFRRVEVRFDLDRLHCATMGRMRAPRRRLRCREEAAPTSRRRRSTRSLGHNQFGVKC